VEEAKGRALMLGSSAVDREPVKGVVVAAWGVWVGALETVAEQLACWQLQGDEIRS